MGEEKERTRDAAKSVESSDRRRSVDGMKVLAMGRSVLAVAGLTAACSALATRLARADKACGFLAWKTVISKEGRSCRRPSVHSAVAWEPRVAVWPRGHGSELAARASCVPARSTILPRRDPHARDNPHQRADASCQGSHLDSLY